MAKRISGYEGSVTLGESRTIYIDRWTGRVEREIIESDDFDTATNWREKFGGRSHLVGSCEGWVDDTTMVELTGFDTADDAPVAGFRLESRGGGTTDAAWTFTGIIGSIDMTVERRGQGRVTVSFESSGAVSVTNYT